jgi:hypothetical protein
MSGMWDERIDNTHLYSALRLTAHMHYKSDGSSSTGTGTGFVVQTEYFRSRDRDREPQRFLVTNRHVLDPDFVKYTGRALESVTIDGYFQNPQHPGLAPERISVTINQPEVHYLDDRPGLDLAVINLATATISGPLLVNSLPSRSLADVRYFDHLNVSAGTSVLMAGYPGIDKVSADRPILVAGTIASDPRYPAAIGPNTYPDEALSHAFSWEGMSGSPVFTVSAGMWDPFRKTHEADVVRVAGINAGHIIIGAGSLTRFVKATALVDLLHQLGVRGFGLPHRSPDEDDRPPLVSEDVELTD